MGNERDDDAERRARADVYSTARIGAAAALTIVLVVLLVLDVAVPDCHVSPGVLLPLPGAILALLGLEASALWRGLRRRPSRRCSPTGPAATRRAARGGAASRRSSPASTRPPVPSLGAWHACTGRVRDSAQITGGRAKSGHATPLKPGRPRVSTEPSAVQGSYTAEPEAGDLLPGISRCDVSQPAIRRDELT